MLYTIFDRNIVTLPDNLALNLMKNKLSNWYNLFTTVLCLFLLISVDSLSAQNESPNYTPENSFISRLFYGGGFGLQFGSATLIELAPIVGYKITPKFGIGIGPTYKYYSYEYYNIPNTHIKTNVFGVSLFARYFILENIFAHVEYESLFYNTQYPGYPMERQEFKSFLVGGGYRQMIGRNAGLNFSVLWNLNDTYNSPYSNPVIRMGFTVGM